MSEFIGATAREKRRLKDMAHVEQHAKNMFEKYFPKVSDPPKVSDFERKWRELQEEMETTFGSPRDFRLAFNRLVREVKHCQKHHRWTVTPPTYLITNKTPKQLRSGPWCKSAWAVGCFARKWEASLERGIDNSPESIFRHLILSFIFHSGHCSSALVIAFHQALLEDRLSLSHWSDVPFISLTTSSTTLNTNLIDDNVYVSCFHCYLMPQTLGLITRWNRAKKQEGDIPSETNAMFWHLLGEDKHQGQLPSSLNSFCRAAIHTCEQLPGVSLNQALVEYRILNNPSYSLPECNLSRIINSDVNRVEPQSFYAYRCDVQYRSKTKLDCRKTEHQDFIRLARQCVKPDVHGKKVTALVIKHRLLALLAQRSFSIPQEIWLKWLLHKSSSCKPSSLASYTSSVLRHWLHMNEGVDLSQLTGEELEDVYHQQIVSIQSPKSRHYFCCRLKDLNALAFADYGFPVIPGSVFTGGKVQKHTRAGFIDEALFLALLNQIDLLTDLDRISKDALQVLCIIAYRCGLRINELKKLQVGNIENSLTGWISIRENSYGNNKTASSLRKVPLYSLLMENENDRVRRYIRNRKNLSRKTTTLVFSFGQDATLPVDTFLVSNFIGRTLKSLSGQDHFVFHHLRHSCANRLQLLLELDGELDNYPNLIPYDAKQRGKIREKLFGESLQNGYYEIAAFMGHESPESTFNNYFHFSDWISAIKLNANQTAISKMFAQTTGMCPRRQYKEIIPRHWTPIASDFSDRLIQRLKVVKISSTVEDGTIPAPLDMVRDEMTSIDICYRILKRIERGEDIRELAFGYNIKQETLNKWVTNAIKIRNYTTKVASNKSRHFPQSRNNQLVPARLQSRPESHRADRLINKLREALREDLQGMKIEIIYAINNISTSKSGIYFNDPSKLKLFLDKFSSVIPKSHWRAVTLHIEQSPVLREWKDAIIGTQKKIGKVASEGGRRGKGAIRLELVSLDEDSRIETSSISKYSTPTLVYITHMVAIMMLS